MSKIDIYMYRAKFIKPSQQEWHVKDLSPRDIFWKSLNEKPSLEMYNCVWHIGNIEKITEDTGVFAVGKTTSKIADQYDENTKDFKNEEKTESPFTLVYYDLKIGLISIVKKLKVANSTDSVSVKLSKLFSNTNVVKEMKVNVEVDNIKNPLTFLKEIDAAYSIKKFTAHFSGPNPYDADEHFQRPMSIYLQNVNGTEGKTEIKGEDLNSDVIHQTAVSIASTGNNASASVLDDADSKPRTISFMKDQLFITIDSDIEETKDILRKLEQKYKSVREL